MKSKIIILLVTLLVSTLPTVAQKAAIKTNLLYDVAATINAGAEAKVAPKWTIDLSANYNSWTIRDHRWKHWLVQPEARYWFCKAFTGHFVGAHVLGGQYNFGNLDLPFSFLGTDFRMLKDYRFQGWMGGAGLVYGYDWIIDRHWNIEAVIGLGWVYTRYDKFECQNCGKKIETKHPHNYVGPTKAAINLVYTF